MFDNWGAAEWVILVVDLIAIVIVVRFLSSKVKSKLAEVEERQNISTNRRREAKQAQLRDTESED
tara:strand:- start:227 stop:421 length:195 start_codon:yes stop_codon:yes gene_type:complete